MLHSLNRHGRHGVLPSAGTIPYFFLQGRGTHCSTRWRWWCLFHPQVPKSFQIFSEAMNPTSWYFMVNLQSPKWMLQFLSSLKIGWFNWNRNPSTFWASHWVRVRHIPALSHAPDIRLFQVLRPNASRWRGLAMEKSTGFPTGKLTFQAQNFFHNALNPHFLWVSFLFFFY